MSNNVIRVISPANIAFIKYWGQRDAAQVLPFNDSFSMNLSACTTTIELEKIEDPAVQEMNIKLFEKTDFIEATAEQLEKVTRFYAVAKKFCKADSDFGFRIRSENNFPMKAGIASSASFFSALALAFATAFGATLDTKQLSILARLSGSGSATRSVPDGFSWWHAGTDSKSSYAESLATADSWDLADLVLVISKTEKKTGSQVGHTGAETSPYFASRQHDLVTTSHALRAAFTAQDFTAFGTLLEQEAINFSHILMTQTQPLIYWTGETLNCMKEIIRMRETGVESYFTIDAGANIHLICEKKNAAKLEEHFRAFSGVETVIVNYPCQGTYLL